MIFTSLLILLSASVLCIVQLFAEIKRTKNTLLILSGVLWNFIILFLIARLVTIKDNEAKPVLGNGVYFGISAAVLLISVLSAVVINKRGRGRINKTSVKESFDSLPIAICFFKENGMPVLTNRLMNELCFELTGETVLNASLFSEKVDGKTLPILNRQYAFSCRTATADSGVLMLTAVDVTKKQELCISLEKENAELEKMNGSLLEYSKEVEKLTHDEEVLKTKKAIHEKLGRMLLEAKIFFESRKTNYADIANKFKNTVTDFENGNVTETEDTDVFGSIKKAAAAINVDIEFEGEIPSVPLLADALRECVTNAVRHANADKVYVKSFGNSVEITNNGNPPSAEIVPTGGLLNLLEAAKMQNAEIRVMSSPVFRLTVTLPQR